MNLGIKKNGHPARDIHESNVILKAYKMQFPCQIS